MTSLLSEVQLIRVSVVIPTADRSKHLFKTINSISTQSYQPYEIIIIDASTDLSTKEVCHTHFPNLLSTIRWFNTTNKGAATQRNLGVELCGTDFIFFMDDDIELYEGCIEIIWNCINSDNSVGGVNAMIVNQKYSSPGLVTRIMYYFMHGKLLNSYAGKCIGPAWNLLPDDSPNIPDYQLVEWLNAGCTMYRREALPIPVFGSNFTGYSLMEDVALSLTVGKKWKLFNAKSAKIFHDSQGGLHKNNCRKLAKMSLVNRHYVMSVILERRKFSDYVKLVIFELYGIFTALRSLNQLRNLKSVILGKCDAVSKILREN